MAMDMATGVPSKRKYEEAISRASSAQNRLKKLKMEGMKITQIGIRSVGVGVAAGLIGYAEGSATRKGDSSSTEVFGLPLGLVVAAVGTVVNVAGYGGDEMTSSLIQSAADGGLAAYAFGKGREKGLEEPKAA